MIPALSPHRTTPWQRSAASSPDGKHGAGLSGLLYVRRRMSSPPVVFRGYTAKSLAVQIREYETRRR